MMTIKGIPIKNIMYLYVFLMMIFALPFIVLNTLGYADKYDISETKKMIAFAGFIVVYFGLLRFTGSKAFVKKSLRRV